MSDVPCDLVREILVNLPAKSVFRLRSVCKEWQHIIDDPSFVKAQAKNQVYNHTLVVVDDSCAPLHSFCLDSINFITNGPQMIDNTPIENPNPHNINLSTSVAPCNGLIVFTTKDMLVIRNPLTKESHNLPQPNDALVTNKYGYAYGFGYDSDSDDYKVVRIDDLSSVVFQTLVYSLKSDSWKRVEDCPCRVRCKELKGALLDGALYWISHNDWIVVSLNLGTERYCQLPLPPVTDLGTERYCQLSLDALDGCLICSFDYYRMFHFDGWVMKDNGVEKLWIKLFSLQYYSLINAPPLGVGGLRLVAYLKRKEQVVLQNLQNRNGFLWFDVANNSIKKFSIHGRRITSSLICPGSLVRLSDYRGGDTTLLSDYDGGDTTLPRNYNGGDTTLPSKMRKKKKKTKKTITRLKFCIRNDGDKCCSDFNRYCSEDRCLRCKKSNHGSRGG